MKKIVILAFCILTLFSCAKKQDTKAALQFYNSTLNFSKETKNSLQKIVDKLTDAILLVKMDKDAVVDTKELRILLDSARHTINGRINKLNAENEIDEEIGLKRKEVAYLELFKSAYNNEIKKGIDILGAKSETRFEETKKTMEPAFLKIKDAELILKTAEAVFYEKYDLKSVDVN